MSNLIKRTVPVFFVLAICISCLVFPAAASSFEVPSTSINILDYATPNNGPDTSVHVDGSLDVYFDLPNMLVFNYFDIVLSSTSDITSVQLVTDNNSHNLSVSVLSPSMFRVYGSPSTYVKSYSIRLRITVQSPADVNFISFHAYNNTLTPKNILGTADIYLNGSKTNTYKQSGPSVTFTHTFDNFLGVGNERYTIDLYADSWRYYDFLAFRFRCDLDINSIVAMSSDGTIPLPVSVSTFSDNDGENDAIYYYCLIDISRIPKDDTVFPLLAVQFSKQNTDIKNYFYFYDCTGFVNVDYVDPNLSFFRKFQHNISNWFQNLIAEVKKLNGSDSEAISAQQKQEAINVSINNQLVGAVEDWNTNIEVVQAGYDLALTNVTPSLLWLSSLADGIFNGMGWFGSIYFLVGLISVIMLVLSKSGLAHKIGNISRRGD